MRVVMLSLAVYWRDVLGVGGRTEAHGTRY